MHPSDCLVDYQRPTKKSLGQHFLTDQYIINELLHLIAVGENDHVIEIGPGSGCLTEHLIHACRQLYAIDLDRDCVPFLREKFEGASQFKVFHQDFQMRCSNHRPSLLFSKYVCFIPLKTMSNL